MAEPALSNSRHLLLAETAADSIVTGQKRTLTWPTLWLLSGRVRQVNLIQWLLEALSLGSCSSHPI